MKLTFAMLIIVFLAFSGYHLSFRNFRLPLFARQFYLTGTEFLFLGLLLGPQFLDLFDREIQMGLAPLSGLLLGWIGMIFGFQFEISKLRRFPLEHLLAAVLEGVLTLTLVFVPVLLTLHFVAYIPGPMKIAISLTLAAAAACTAQSGLALMAPDCIGRCRDSLNILRYFSSIDGLGALLIFGLAFYFHAPSFSEVSLTVVGRGILFTLGASVGLMLLFALFVSLRRPVSELTLVVIGMTVLTSGMASALNFSPLLINFFVGFWIVNLSREKERIYQILVTVEKPSYLLLLVFLGAGLQFKSAWVFLLAGGYCLCRLLGKFLSAFLITWLTPGLRRHPPNLGFGLLAQGGLPLAILLDFQQAFRSDITTVVISVSLVAVIYNEFLSPYFLNRLLARDK